MEALKIIFLAVLQGITEFLPISSSGHLVIFGKLLGIDEPGARLEIMLHFGTLLSILFFYRKIIGDLIRGIFSGNREKLLLASAIVVSAIPAIIAYVFLKDTIDGLYDGSSAFVGIMLMITAAVLISLNFIPNKDDNEDRKPVKLWKAFLVGLAQAVALLPGISRSGSTISCARFLGIGAKKAAEFSFLMVLPVLLGGTVLQIIDDLTRGGEESSDGFGLLAVAVIISAVTGYFALKLLIRVLSSRYFWLFGCYCFLAGLFLIMRSIAAQ